MVGWHHRLNGYEFEQTLGDTEGWGSKLGVLPSMALKSWTQVRVNHHHNNNQKSSSELRHKFREMRLPFPDRQKFHLCSVIYPLPITFILSQSYWLSKVILRHCPSDLSSSDFLMLALLSCCSLWAWILIVLTQHPFQENTVSLTCPNECCCHNGIHLPNYWKVTPNLKTFDTCQYRCSGVCLLWNDDIKCKQMFSNWWILVIVI